MCSFEETGNIQQTQDGYESDRSTIRCTNLEYWTITPSPDSAMQSRATRHESNRPGWRCSSGLSIYEIDNNDVTPDDDNVAIQGDSWASMTDGEEFLNAYLSFFIVQKELLLHRV